MSEILAKGERTEELLREYFLELGYFVIRSVKFTYREFDVTDVDLFLYSKSSPFSREKTIVDIKKKKTPQAIERIFWTKGLQEALGMDKAIVATTDNRSDVAEFGKKNKINVLDGNLIMRIEERFMRMKRSRITEEAFTEIMRRESIGDLYGNWKDKNEELKALFINEISFNTCNRILKSIKEVLEYYITTNKNELSKRLLYLHVSYFLIALDYSMKDLSFIEEDQRKQSLDMYFKYGQTGYQRTQEIIGYIQSFLSSTPAGSEIHREAIKEAVESDISSIKADVLAEYFCKITISSKIFDIARYFESYAYAIEVPHVEEIPAEDQAIIALMSDFFSIDRKKVL